MVWWKISRTTLLVSKQNKNLMEYLNNEKKLMEVTLKNFQSRISRKKVVDPFDGLRPLKSFRHRL